MAKPCLKCQKESLEFNPKKPLYCLKCEPVRKSRAAAAVLKVDFKRENQRLLTVLHRDIGRLMEISHAKALTKDESAMLVSYLKLISELKAIKLLEDAENGEQNQ
jgi:hypothetical protein